MSLSPDGRRVAVTRAESSGGVGGVGGLPASHVWMADLSRAIFSRLTAEQASQTSQVITPDGRVVFSTTLNAGIGDLYWMPGNGVGMPEPLIAKSPTVKHPNDVSPDGRFLIYDDHTSQRQDLWILPLTPPSNGGERKPFPFLVTAADETFGQFSRRTVDRLRLGRVGHSRGLRAGLRAQRAGRAEAAVRPGGGPARG